ncbi:heterokaryon incompatibility [Fusarium albosuccineum]|uniref:Heterokaryon incompatibility n=1 Tax=Fusarium albosuccineum TaxID=1237068 RepID=A0A8H4LKR0_9HYPO|nr:heterokaryon incompatibility [Fusarium albosuccineum]
MTGPQLKGREAGRALLYKHQALESPFHIRLLHLLPGETGEQIKMQISHALLRESSEPTSIRLTRAQLQQTLPPNWEVEETIEGRFIFMYEPDSDGSSVGTASRQEEDMSSNGESARHHTWTHPDTTIDPASYELPSSPELCSGLEFEALSYVWGTQHAPEIAVVESATREPMGIIELGKNLVSALHHLRYKDKARALWVDAICINQNDDIEKSAQVLRMSNIFHYCSRVIAWLGPEGKDTTQAFSALAHIGAQVERTTNGFLTSSPDAEESAWYDSSVNIPFPDDIWLAIGRLAKRHWFRRLWTVQEAIVANRFSIVQSGHATIPWPLFRRGILCLLEKDHVPESRLYISQLTSTVKYSIGAPLAHILDLYQIRECLDLHDKIYALLAVLPPKFVAAITPDYEQPVEELYKSAFLAHINTLQRWELRGCPRDPSQRTCPSWVPDLSQYDPFGRKVEHHFASGCSSLHFEYQAPDIFKVIGVRFDTVKSVSEKTFDHWDDGRRALETIRSWEPPGLLTESYPGGGSLLDAFATTLVQDGTRERHPTEGSSLEYIKERCRTEFLSTASTPISELGRQDMTEYAIWTRCKGRSMVTTNTGSIGMASTLARPGESKILIHPSYDSILTLAGDVICVLLGCDFPVLLRPSENNTWKFISDCYVWDLEASQGLLGPLPSPWQAHLLYHPVYEHGTYNRYFNPDTGELTAEDPRLGPLEGWQRIPLEELGRDLTGDDPEVYDFFSNTEDGRVVNSDPRLEPEALKGLGVDLETFVLT